MSCTTWPLNSFTKTKLYTFLQKNSYELQIDNKKSELNKYKQDIKTKVEKMENIINVILS